MRIDGHQHFWALARGDYGWLSSELEPIYRDFLPGELLTKIAAAEISGTVLVQAAPTVAETDYLLSLADEHAFIKGVVGWADFESGEAAAEIERLCKHPALVGFRPMIQDIADDDWMTRPALEPAFQALLRQDRAFDALTLPRHLKRLHRLLQDHPTMRCVIDHGSKPRIAEGAFQPWADDMSALARDTSAYCKLSGLVTEAGDGWSVETLKPYVDHLLDTFGPMRIIWGSDWPVVNLACSYEVWLEATDQLLGDLKAPEREAVLGLNAAKAYRLRD